MKDVNTNLHKMPNIDSGSIEYACLDARQLAIEHSSEIMFSSSENPSRIGNRWIIWRMPSGREIGTWWNHGVGLSKVKAAATTEVTVEAWNGKRKV